MGKALRFTIRQCALAVARTLYPTIVNEQQSAQKVGSRPTGAGRSPLSGSDGQKVLHGRESTMKFLDSCPKRCEEPLKWQEARLLW